jgi:hypothetical protein
MKVTSERYTVPSISTPLLPMHRNNSPSYSYHNIKPNISKIHYNVIFPSMTMLDERSISFEFLHNVLNIFHKSLHMLHTVVPPIGKKKGNVDTITA